MPSRKAVFLLWIVASVAAIAGCDAADDNEEPYKPSITAEQVVDRATLKTFVEEASRIYAAMLERQSLSAVNQEFKLEGGYWKHEDIYVFVLDLDGNVILHAGNPSLEGDNLIDLEDPNGVMIVKELIDLATSGGGYLEYYFDNPAISGDEVEGSLKLGYSLEITSPELNNGEPAMIGSGFYPRLIINRPARSGYTAEYGR